MTGNRQSPWNSNTFPRLRRGLRTHTYSVPTRSICKSGSETRLYIWNYILLCEVPRVRTRILGVLGNRSLHARMLYPSVAKHKTSGGKVAAASRAKCHAQSVSQVPYRSVGPWRQAICASLNSVRRAVSEHAHRVSRCAWTCWARHGCFLTAIGSSEVKHNLISVIECHGELRENKAGGAYQTQACPCSSSSRSCKPGHTHFPGRQTLAS